MPDQANVVVAAQVCNLLAEPRRTRKRLILGVELELRDDQPRIGAIELVDLPFEAAEVDVMAGLFHQKTRTERDQLAPLIAAGGVLVLLPRCHDAPVFVDSVPL